MKKIKVEFLGRSATDVTQSCYQVTSENHTILLDYGLYQDQNPIENYKVNHTRIKEVRPRKLDYIFISHANIDHCGALPELYRRGCTAKIIVPSGNKDLIHLMLKDSAKIMAADAEKLKKIYKMKAYPLYTEDDIAECMEHMEEFPFGEDIDLGGMSFRFYPAHHIVNAAQIYLEFQVENGAPKRILYTGDIGSPSIDKLYVEPFAYPQGHIDLVIGESTYAGDQRVHQVRDREKDKEKIRTIVKETCLESGGKVLFPVFALDRLQVILTVLYEVFGDNPDFKIPIVVDTPLGISVCQMWEDLIPCGRELWDKVMKWDNIRFTTAWEESIEHQKSKGPMIILASSGMCTNGRSVVWVKNLLASEQNHICFCGYSAEGSLAAKIKEGSSKNPTLQVEGRNVPNRAKITSLFSFSSHACRSELMQYYSGLRYGKLCLVHGDQDDKLAFGMELREKLLERGISSPVIAAFTGYEISI
ncbi:MAG: MBL fold metallo-hydrolase [Clostridia bacterium]|nr:MBL fold metallo-hydrolase [Clostridia bacterium]